MHIIDIFILYAKMISDDRKGCKLKYSKTSGENIELHTINRGSARGSKFPILMKILLIWLAFMKIMRYFCINMIETICS